MSLNLKVLLKINFNKSKIRYYKYNQKLIQIKINKMKNKIMKIKWLNYGNLR
jgi:hypothetical protein